MSSLELNKIAGAVLVGGMVALVSGIIADHLVEPEPLGTHAVTVAAGEQAAGGEAAGEAKGPEIEPVIPLLASADVAAGEKTAKRCMACHTFNKGGSPKIGPNLWGVIGGPKAHEKDFNYSDAIAGLGGNWTYKDLNHFLTSPRDFAPGTKMTFAGLKKVQDRANVIAWLRTQSDNPPPLPEASAAAAPAEEAKTGTAEGAEPAKQPAPAEAKGGEAAQQAAAPAGDAVAARIAKADPENGAKIARRCMACHSFDKGGSPKIGPNLWGVVGGPKAHEEGFNYSDAITSLGGNWTYDDLDKFLESPRKYAPGTKMTFAGLRKPEDRADVIAWLRQQSDNPAPLP